MNRRLCGLDLAVHVASVSIWDDTEVVPYEGRSCGDARLSGLDLAGHLAPGIVADLVGEGLRPLPFVDQ